MQHSLSKKLLNLCFFLNSQRSIIIQLKGLSENFLIFEIFNNNLYSTVKKSIDFMQDYNRNNMNQQPKGNRGQQKFNPAEEAAITAFHDKIMGNIQSFKQDNDKIRAQIEEVRRMSQVERRKSDFIEETLKEITGQNYSRKMDQNPKRVNQPRQIQTQSEYQGKNLTRYPPPTQPFNQIISNEYVQRSSYPNSNNFQQQNFSSQSQLLSKIAEAEKRALQYKNESQKLRKQAESRRGIYGQPQLASLFEESQQLQVNASKLIKKKQQSFSSNNRSYETIKSPTYQSSKFSKYQTNKFGSYDTGKFDKYEPAKASKYQPAKYSTYETNKFDKYDKYEPKKYDAYEPKKYDTYDSKKYDQPSKYEYTSKIQSSKYKADTYKTNENQKTGSIQAASISFPTKLNVTSVVSTSEVNKQTTKIEKSPTQSKKIDNQAILQDMKRVM